MNNKASALSVVSFMTHTITGSQHVIIITMPLATDNGVPLHEQHTPTMDGSDVQPAAVQTDTDTQRVDLID